MDIPFKEENLKYKFDNIITMAKMLGCICEYYSNFKLVEEKHSLDKYTIIIRNTIIEIELLIFFLNGNIFYIELFKQIRKPKSIFNESKSSSIDRNHELLLDFAMEKLISESGM